MSFVETEGIVIDSKPYKERDRLVKIFTEKSGIKTIFARRSMTPRYQHYQAIQPCARANYVLDIKEEHLSYIKTVKEVMPYTNISIDIEKKAYAVYFASLVNAALNKNEADPLLYGFLRESYDCLENGLDAEVISFIFEIQMLKRFGVMPDFNKCQICGENDMKVVYDYSQEYGGIVCYKHFNEKLKRYHAHPRAIYYFRKFLNVDLNGIKEINLNDDTKLLIRQLIDQLYDDYTGLKLKSRKFIDEMSKMKELLLKVDIDKNSENI